MGKKFRTYNLDEPELLPPDMRQWLPKGHLVLYVPGAKPRVVRRAGPWRSFPIHDRHSPRRRRNGTSRTPIRAS
jgi:hypothetical protein